MRSSTSAYHTQSLEPGRTDWGAIFSWGDEAEDDVPGAPKRAGSSTFDYWFENCGHVVSASDNVLSQLSTPWTKFIARSAYEVAKKEAGEELCRLTMRGRAALGFLSMRLAETPTGKLLHTRRKTAEMNARYVKRVYVGKKKTEAKKRRRANAAMASRERKRATSHGNISITDDTFWYENQCIAAATEARALVTQSKRIQL